MTKQAPEPQDKPEVDEVTVTHSPDGTSAIITVNHPDDTQTIVVLSGKNKEDEDDE